MDVEREGVEETATATPPQGEGRPEEDDEEHIANQECLIDCPKVLSFTDIIR